MWAKKCDECEGYAHTPNIGDGVTQCEQEEVWGRVLVLVSLVSYEIIPINDNIETREYMDTVSHY